MYTDYCHYFPPVLEIGHQRDYRSSLLHTDRHADAATSRETNVRKFQVHSRKEIIYYFCNFFPFPSSLIFNYLIFQEKSDARLRLLNEILQGIRLIKLHAWENLFEDRIRKTREQELKLLKKDSVYWALISK